METLEVHTLICHRDVQQWLNTLRLFRHYTLLDFVTIIHDDGSLTSADIARLQTEIDRCFVLRRSIADEQIRPLLKNHPNCRFFRFAEHHTIFRIKLFDPFLLSPNKSVLMLDSDILFCREPQAMLDRIHLGAAFYMKDSWSSYCVPFRPEDANKDIEPAVCAGLVHVPSAQHYSLDKIEECLGILYAHGSRGATHPFLEQTCLAYMIKQLGSYRPLPHPDYCVPRFERFVPDHRRVALHLNSSPLVGKYRAEHYAHEMDKLAV